MVNPKYQLLSIIDFQIKCLLMQNMYINLYNSSSLLPMASQINSQTQLVMSLSTSSSCKSFELYRVTLQDLLSILTRTINHLPTSFNQYFYRIPFYLHMLPDLEDHLYPLETAAIVRNLLVDQLLFLPLFLPKK